jgi:hypothetical protein
MSDASSELLRAVRSNIVNFGRFSVERIRSRSWASATFTGVRHELAFAIEGEDSGAAADAFLAGLADAEFGLRGHFVADIALVSQSREGRRVRIELEALTIEEG